jgi:hypothetical protein
MKPKRKEDEMRYIIYIALAIGALIGSLQMGIGMGFNYALDNYADFRDVPTKTVEVEKIVYRDNPVASAPAAADASITKATCQQVVDWLAQDKTDSTPYDKDSFTCVDYCVKVKENATLAGIKCGILYVWKEDGTAHSLSIFDTIDKGLVYVEPQFDWVIPEPKVGLIYGELVKSVEKNYDGIYTYQNKSPIKRVLPMW